MLNLGEHVARISLPLGDGRLRGFHHRTRPVDQDHHEVHREEGQRGFQIETSGLVNSRFLNTDLITTTMF